LLDFLGIGAHKSGTSWLHLHLSHHPDIAFPGGKETHFWDMYLERGEAWWHAMFAGGRPGLKQGEITPAYAFLGEHLIRRIRDAYPALRLLYCIRNPIDRAWAHLRFASARRGIPIDTLTDERIIEQFESASSCKRGDHLANLQRWRAAFPDEQICVLFFDDIIEDPQRVLERVACHIGVDPERLGIVVDPREKILPGPAVELKPALRDYLIAKYRDDVGKIAVAFDRDLHHWLSRSAPAYDRSLGAEDLP
jgi:hypothetical protein